MAFAAASSPFCRPEEDPFLLLDSALKALEAVLKRTADQPLQRSWIDYPYGEEEITLLEEEVLPVLQRCIERIDEIDADLERQRDLAFGQEVMRELRLCAGR